MLAAEVEQGDNIQDILLHQEVKVEEEAAVNGLPIHQLYLLKQIKAGVEAEEFHQLHLQ
jgi:hypothetical protein